MKRIDPYNYLQWYNRNIHMYNFNDKEQAVRNYGDYMLNRTQQIFEWSGLPNTIPQRNLELFLQTAGHCVIVKHENKYYAVLGGFGGEPNVYYEPTLYVVANPALPTLKPQWIINEDCVLVRNDTLIKGINPLLSRYCSLLVENDITFRIANINTRINEFIGASDDRTLKSAKKFLEDIESGKLGVISENQFFEGLNVNNVTRGNVDALKSLIEFHQYIRASMYQDLGLDANHSMKRSQLNTAEVELNTDALFPLVDDMYYQRKQACKLLKEIYDLDIDVDFNSAWKRNQEQEEVAILTDKVNIEKVQAETNEILDNSSDNTDNTDNTDLNIIQEQSKETQINDSTSPENETNELDTLDTNETEQIKELLDINITIINNSEDITIDEEGDTDVSNDESAESIKNEIERPMDESDN